MSAFAGTLFPIARPRVTLPFADRSFRAYRDRPHRGVDLAPFPGSTGEPIRASLRSAVVAANAFGNARGIGNEVLLRVSFPFAITATALEGWVEEIPAGELLIFRYGHLDEILVEVGDVIDAGTVLGTIGSTGFAFGPHLHLELQRGNRVLDPMDAFSGSIVGLSERVEIAG